MIIDNLYEQIDKTHFYLGMISQVYRGKSVIQIENLSWFEHRKVRTEFLIPNTINFLVVVESTRGIFLAEVFESKISNSDSIHEALIEWKQEKIYPEISIEIVAFKGYGNSKFEMPSYYTAGIGDKVYIANQKIIQQYMQSLEINRNETQLLSPFAKVMNLEDETIQFSSNTLFNRHLLTVGTTNSGKSTSSLAILDTLLKEEKKILIVDPTGEYKHSFSEEEITKLTLGEDTFLRPGSLSFTQWVELFELNDASQPAVLANAINSLRYQLKKGNQDVYEKVGKSPNDVETDMTSLSGEIDVDFDLQLLPKQIIEEAVEVDRSSKYIRSTFQFNNKQWLVEKVQYKLSNTTFCNFFSSLQTTESDLLRKIKQFAEKEKKSLYIDASKIGVGDESGSVIIDLICQELLKLELVQPFVVFIDEVHRYASKNNEYCRNLTALAREGRKKGMFLFLTTQNPLDVSDVLLGQVGTLLVHRLTHDNELHAIKNHLSSQSVELVKKLNTGEAILSSINILKDMHLKIIKSSREHDNMTPFL